jgi:hypothetical protein
METLVGDIAVPGSVQVCPVASDQRRTRGKSVGESDVPPLLPPETPRNLVPVMTAGTPAVSDAGPVTTGRQASWAPVSSNSSAEESAIPPPSPPTTSTLPDSSRVVVWSERIRARLREVFHVFVPGLYTTEPESVPLFPSPPETSTLPDGSSVAE